MSIDEINETLTKIIVDTAEKLAKESPTNQNIFKISPTTQKLIEKRTKLNANTNHIEFIELNKTIKKNLRIEKRSHNTRIIQNTIENNKSLKRTFKNMSPGQNQIISLKDKNENILYDRHQMSNRIKEFYEDLYDTKTTNKINKPPNNYEHENDVPNIILGEIEMALKSMPNNKTPGPDSITTDMIKNGGIAVLKIIQVLFNKCLKEKKIPQKWNNANTILIYKKGDRTDLKKTIDQLVSSRISINYLPKS
jgi:hypothetical protein